MAENTATERLEVTEFLERNAGSDYHRAVMLSVLQGEAEAAYEELRYDDPADPELLAALKLIVDRRFTVGGHVPASPGE